MHTTRARHYALLSRLLADQSRKSDLARYLAWAEDLAKGQEKRVLQPFIEILRTWLQKEDADQGLQVEFGHLFLMPVGVKPYESAYRSKEKLLMQEPWVEVKKFFKKCGLQMKDSYGHPEDHAAIELSFMAHAVGSDAEEDVGKEFFHQHIITWIPDLLLDLRDNDYADFFRGVAEYGLLFLEAEKKHYHKTS